MLSQVAREILESVGWSPTRRIDLTAQEKTLTEHGFTLHDRVRQLLENVGNLRVIPRGNVDELFHFDVRKACHNRAPAWVHAYAEKVGEPLCPIGESWCGHMILCMAPSGRIYAGYDEELFRICDDEASALETLCTGKGDQPQIPW